jgi:hypothetical protein
MPRLDAHVQTSNTTQMHVTHTSKAWAANEEQARVAADKLLAIDEVIYTRILQRDWEVPPEVEGLLLIS